ncbi:MAG: hypothetical protein IIW77_01460, partial [Bacteroidaceae bacterium]|nr:hypothetical protein [Bacteroidaceae bacterium]
FKISKTSKHLPQTSKITPQNRHILSFVKQNTPIRQKEKTRKVLFLTNDKMSKNTDDFTFLHQPGNGTKCALRHRLGLTYFIRFLFVFSRAIYYLCTNNGLKFYTI